MNPRHIRIGARGSKLSLAQAGGVRDAIAAALGEGGGATLEPVVTQGDRIQDRRLTDIGGKALFTREIEEGLRDGRFDCAVHSMKDMPAEDPEGLVIAAVPVREDPRDAFLSERHAGLEQLPRGARLGTASLRRAAQCRYARPDLEVLPMRGNVDTRLAKLAAGEADAILLAASGLNRLGLGHLPREFFDPIERPPAPAQGALAIQTRAEDADAPWLASLRCPTTTLAILAERAVLRVLEGSCRSAIGAYATIDGRTLRLVVEALTPSGTRRFRRQGECEAQAGAAQDLGARLAGSVREEAGDALEDG